MIMRATLHDHAPNTYYGQWPRGKAVVCGPRITLYRPWCARCERRIRDLCRPGM